MKRAPRPVVVASIAGQVVRLAPIDNGAGWTPGMVADLATRAGLEPRRTRGATLIPLSSLPDLEAYAEFLGIVVQRSTRRTS